VRQWLTGAFGWQTACDRLEPLARLYLMPCSIRADRWNCGSHGWPSRFLRRNAAGRRRALRGVHCEPLTRLRSLPTSPGSGIGLRAPFVRCRRDAQRRGSAGVYVEASWRVGLLETRASLIFPHGSRASTSIQCLRTAADTHGRRCARWKLKGSALNWQATRRAPGWAAQCATQRQLGDSAPVYANAEALPTSSGR